MDLIGFICLGIGAAIIAANQALKEAPTLTARFPALRPRGWWNYLPFGFFLLACPFYLIHYLTPPAPPLTAQTSALAPVAGPNPRPVAVREKARPPSIVVTGVPVDRLKGYFEGRTTAEARRLVQPFIGASVYVNGPVGDVFGRTGQPILWLGQEGRVVLRFRADQEQSVQRFQPGEPLRARCRFEGRVSPVDIEFENCVLVSR